ncbi:MAG: hypothetical protein ACFCU8_03955 [Thermosynechococcaceae cyanobacterium]
MASPTPLTGINLIDCAQANSKQGLAVAAQQCGYGPEIETFIEALQSACNDIGVDVQALDDLITERQQTNVIQGIRISPDSQNQL